MHIFYLGISQELGALRSDCWQGNLAKYKIPHMPRLSVLCVKHSSSRVTTYSFLVMRGIAVQLHSSKIDLVEIMELHSTN